MLSFGGVVISLAPISIGVPLVVLPKFAPPIFLQTIQKYKVTVSIHLPIISFRQISCLTTCLLEGLVSCPTRLAFHEQAPYGE